MKVTARVTRSKGWWAIEVPEVPGVFTQAKRLNQVAAMVTDAVALMCDVDPSDVEVAIQPALPPAIDDHLRTTKELALRAARAQQEASKASRSTVHELRDLGLSVRDVAQLLDVSPQRISQLAPSAAETSEGSR